MSGAFSFDVDAARDLVRITMAGFFTDADVARFLDAREVAHRRLRCGPNEHLTLNDIREMKIQPQDTVAMFARVLADSAYRSRRLAFVTTASLARMQAMRALGSRDARFFTDPDDAEAWVLTGDSPAALPLRRALS